jgi:hypothetical protein
MTVNATALSQCGTASANVRKKSAYVVQVKHYWFRICRYEVYVKRSFGAHLFDTAQSDYTEAVFPDSSPNMQKDAPP